MNATKERLKKGIPIDKALYDQIIKISNKHKINLWNQSFNNYQNKKWGEVDNKLFKSIYTQTFKNFEIILVDNFSTDNTVKKAKQLGVRKIIKIQKYLPGKALNAGIKKSLGDYIVCLSAHCIPKNNEWLKKLLKILKMKKLQVYMEDKFQWNFQRYR